MRGFWMGCLALLLAACAQQVPTEPPPPQASAAQKPPMDMERYQQGVNAFWRRDRAAAIELLTPLAEAGYPKASDALAHVYYHLIPVDTAKAYAIIYPVAQQGDADAQATLGNFLIMSYCGRVWKMTKCLEAADWLTKSADQGNIFAMYRLARLEITANFPSEHSDLKKMYFYEYYRKSRDPITDIWGTLDSLRRQISPEDAAEMERAAKAWEPKPTSP